MNVIADDVIWKRDWLLDALRIFRGYQVWMVGVHVSDAEGARREQERGDRHPGWNRGSARAAHADAEYDFEVDTTATPVAVLARRLDGLYRACPEPHGVRPATRAFSALTSTRITASFSSLANNRILLRVLDTVYWYRTADFYLGEQ